MQKQKNPEKKSLKIFDVVVYLEDATETVVFADAEGQRYSFYAEREA